MTRSFGCFDESFFLLLLFLAFTTQRGDVQNCKTYNPELNNQVNKSLNRLIY